MNELLENVAIYACRASWNGCNASWLEAGATFRRSSRLHPLCLDLLVGFMQGWCDSDGRVDIYASKIEFLKSNLWWRAALTALQYAEKHYAPRKFVKIRARTLTHASPRYFMVFYRQLSRVVKYLRRGIHFPDLEQYPVYRIWTSIEWINLHVSWR